MAKMHLDCEIVGNFGEDAPFKLQKIVDEIPDLLRGRAFIKKRKPKLDFFLDFVGAMCVVLLTGLTSVYLITENVEKATMFAFLTIMSLLFRLDTKK